jgi:hypothetical protein
LTIILYGHVKTHQVIKSSSVHARLCKLDLREINAKIFPVQLSTVVKGTKRLSAFLKKK